MMILMHKMCVSSHHTQSLICYSLERQTEENSTHNSIEFEDRRIECRFCVMKFITVGRRLSSSLWCRENMQMFFSPSTQKFKFLLCRWFSFINQNLIRRVLSALLRERSWVIEVPFSSRHLHNELEKIFFFSSVEYFYAN